MNRELPVTTVHIAGKPERGIQRCFRCNWVLTDNRRTLSTDGRGLSWWEPGAYIGVTHGTRPVQSIVLERDALGTDEQACECPPVEVDGGPVVQVYQ